jgi:hypothetical protein
MAFVGTSDCGMYVARMQINAHAGRDAHWVDLGWCFRMYSGKEILISIFSGSMLLNSRVGIVTLSTDEFIKLPITGNGEMEILAPIKAVISNSSRNVGQIRIKFIVELGQKWDWHVFNHMLEVQADDRLAKFKRRLFRKTDGIEPSSIAYPIHVEIYNISIFDLFPVHILAANSPQVHAECGSFMQSTSIRDHGGDKAAWQDLSWQVHMMSERANIIFDVVSGGSKIGRFALSGMDLCRIPRSKTGKFQITGVLAEKNINRGNLRADCQLFRAKSGKNWKREEPEVDDHKFLNPLDVRQVPFFGDSSSVIATAKHTVPLADRSGVSTADAVDAVSGPIVADNIYADDDSLDLPARVTVNQIIAAELKSVHFHHRNSPQVIVRCGHYERSTSIFSHGGASGKWPHLDWKFPLARGMVLEVIVVSVSKGLLPGSGPVQTVIGSVSLTAGEVSQWVKNRRGETLISKHISNGTEVRGGIQLHLIVTKERETSLVKFFPDTMTNYLLDVDKSGILVRAFEPVDSPNRSLYPATAMTMEKLKAQTAAAFPFRLTITRITVADLKSVHFLHANTPFVNAACGLWAQSTKV